MSLPVDVEPGDRHLLVDSVARRRTTDRRWHRSIHSRRSGRSAGSRTRSGRRRSSTVCQAPSPSRARRLLGSTTNGSLPTSDKRAPTDRYRDRDAVDDVEVWRRSSEPSIVQITPSGAITMLEASASSPSVMSNVSGSPVRREHRRLVVDRVDDGETAGADGRNRLSTAESRKPDRRTEPEIGRLDLANLGGAVVQQVRACCRLGDADVLPRSLGVDAGDRPTGVPVDEHDRARRAMRRTSVRPATTRRRPPADHRS